MITISITNATKQDLWRSRFKKFWLKA